MHRQQIDNCSVVLLSTHSSANTEKYELEFRLCTNFLSSQVSISSNSITAENFDGIGHSEVLLQRAAEEVHPHLQFATAPLDQM